MHLLPGLCVLAGSTAACRQNRPKHLIDNDNVILAIGRAGRSRFAIRGHESITGVGEAILTGGGEPEFKDTREHSRLICLGVPKSAMSARVRASATRSADAFRRKPRRSRCFAIT